MSERIDSYRKSQPIQELRRKARKAYRKQNIWTEEERDLAYVEADEMMKKWRPLRPA
jgi:hypothetical protein